MAAQRGNHIGVGERHDGVELRGEFEQRRRLDRIDLVQRENLDAAKLRQPSQNGLDLRVEALSRIDEEGHSVGVARPAPGRGHHGAVEPALWREDARRIDEDDLRRALNGDAAHEAAGGLDLARDDRDLRPDELVDERRFAGVRGADEGDEAATRGGGAALTGRRIASILLRVHATPFSLPDSMIFSRVIKALAAPCSASRLAGPFASAGAKPGSSIDTVNSGA